MFKWIKRIVIGSVILGVLGTGIVLTGASSYVRSSGRMLKTAVKESIPFEFEIQRARDLLDDLVPELRANLRLVAAEEVEVANLEKEIDTQKEDLEAERGKVRKLRTALNQQKASYRYRGIDYGREELVSELARRFDQLRTTEKLIDGRMGLLKNRKRTLDAAIRKLETTRLARVQLEAEIESLEGQFRLTQAQAAESQFQIDDSKLAQTRRVIGELRKRLDIAQRVLAREAKFVENIPVEVGFESETSVVDRVDAYFDGEETRVLEKTSVLVENF